MWRVAPYGEAPKEKKAEEDAAKKKAQQEEEVAKKKAQQEEEVAKKKEAVEDAAKKEGATKKRLEYIRKRLLDDPDFEGPQ